MSDLRTAAIVTLLWIVGLIGYLLAFRQDRIVSYQRTLVTRVLGLTAMFIAVVGIADTLR